MGDTTLRPVRKANAVLSSLNRFTEMLSAQMTWPGAAPTRAAIFSPTFPGKSIHAVRSTEMLCCAKQKTLPR